MSPRDRVVTALMTVSLLATVGLGTAAAVTLSRGNAPVTYQTGAVVAQNGGTAAGPSATAGATAAGTGPHTTTTTTGGSAGTAPGINSSQNFTHNGVITVGGIFDESGPLDATVERDTVRSYFDQVNAAGGVNGAKLQLIDCDSQFNPSVAHSCSEKLLSQGILAIVGWTSVSGEQTEAPFLDTQTSSCPQCGVPIFGGLGVDAEFQSPLSFPVADPLGTQGYAGGIRACQVGFKHPAVVYLSASFAASVNGGFLAGLNTCGQAPVKGGNDDVAVDISSQQDYTSIVTPWLTDGTQSVIAGLDPFSMGRLYQAMEREQFQKPTSGGGLDKTSAEGSYGDYFKGAYSLTPVLEPVGHTSVPAMADYLNTVKRYYPTQVSAMDQYTEEQWIAAHVFVAALRAIKGPVTRAALVAAAQGLKNFSTGGLTQPLTYGGGKNNDPNRWVQYMDNPSGTANGWTDFTGWVDIPYNPF